MCAFSDIPRNTISFIWHLTVVESIQTREIMHRLSKYNVSVEYLFRHLYPYASLQTTSNGTLSQSPFIKMLHVLPEPMTNFLVGLSVSCPDLKILLYLDDLLIYPLQCRKKSSLVLKPTTQFIDIKLNSLSMLATLSFQWMSAIMFTTQTRVSQNVWFWFLLVMLGGFFLNHSCNSIPLWG